MIDFVSNVHESPHYEINGGVFILHVFAYFGSNAYYCILLLISIQRVFLRKPKKSFSWVRVNLKQLKIFFLIEKRVLKTQLNHLAG
jgi:hypothetical protein